MKNIILIVYFLFLVVSLKSQESFVKIFDQEFVLDSAFNSNGYFYGFEPINTKEGRIKVPRFFKHLFLIDTIYGHTILHLNGFAEDSISYDLISHINRSKLNDFKDYFNLIINEKPCDIRCDVYFIEEETTRYEIVSIESIVYLLNKHKSSNYLFIDNIFYSNKQYGKKQDRLGFSIMISINDSKN